jgi:hypothetical protein
MPTASLNLTVVDKRMMNEAEASSYCGLPSKHFKAVCPVQPLNLGGKGLRYDKQDLDQWIDSEKSDGSDVTATSVLGKLK